MQTYTLKEAREKMGWTRKFAATKLGLKSDRHLLYIENGEVAIRQDSLKEFADVYQIQPEQIAVEVVKVKAVTTSKEASK